MWDEPKRWPNLRLRSPVSKGELLEAIDRLDNLILVNERSEFWRGSVIGVNEALGATLHWWKN